MTVIVLAFDGLVASTLDLRAEAMGIALRDVGVHTSAEQLLGLLPGRSLEEVVRAAAGKELDASDPTGVELIVMRAQRTMSQRMLRGVEVASAARSWLCDQRSRGVRVVLRADSVRTDVDRALQMFDLEELFGFVSCADDPVPSSARQPFGNSSLTQHYQVISIRLDRQRISTERLALETSQYAARTAATSVGRASCVGADVFTTLPRLIDSSHD